MYISVKVFVILILSSVLSCVSAKEKNKDIDNVKVYYEKGKYGGWPANWGIWSWGNEVLVGFTQADFVDKERGHTFDQKSSITKFARSIDGGISWSIEDAYDAGITEGTVEHNLGNKSIPAKPLAESIDFTNPNFALTFRMCDMYIGPSSFYYSYDRGKTWVGAFELKVDFPERDPAGIVARTDYIVEGKHELTAFLTVGFKDGDKKWREVACVRTSDGGQSWKFLSWIGSHKINSIMPSSVRLDESRLLTVIRRTKPPRMVSFLSEDNGNSWTQLADPVKVDYNGNPPALLKLKDGRLSLVYGIRGEKTMSEGIGMYVSYSSDEGQSWSEPELLRGHDGACWDIGYPRSVLLPDGKVVAIYYYNNANAGDKYRYIAATIFDPDLK
ncbi:sialidase family protein [Sunxiuqinia sp. A32]|uniref:sialidase family protein n=1 Tax=Sunxiuqinia sp. A32 TaxID=3461496 RepID=UPI0040455D0C